MASSRWPMKKDKGDKNQVDHGNRVWQTQKSASGPTCCGNGCPHIRDFRLQAWGLPDWLAQRRCGHQKEMLLPPGRGDVPRTGSQTGSYAHKDACRSCTGRSHCPPRSKVAPPPMASWGNSKLPNIQIGSKGGITND